MFDSESAVRQRAVPPTFVAQVELRAGLGVSIAKTLGPGHFTVWGDPEMLLSVARVIDKITG